MNNIVGDRNMRGGFDFPYGENLIFPHFVITVSAYKDHPRSSALELGASDCVAHIPL